MQQSDAKHRQELNAETKRRLSTERSQTRLTWHPARWNKAWISRLCPPYFSIVLPAFGLLNQTVAVSVAERCEILLENAPHTRPSPSETAAPPSSPSVLTTSHRVKSRPTRRPPPMVILAKFQSLTDVYAGNAAVLSDALESPKGALSLLSSRPSISFWALRLLSMIRRR